MIKTTLRDKTLELLQNRSVKLPLRKIAKDTGLTEGWLSMFGRDQIPEPSVNSVQTLYEYLAKLTIKV